jgi:hypothetical protein
MEREPTILPNKYYQNAPKEIGGEDATAIPHEQSRRPIHSSFFCSLSPAFA